MLKSYLSLFKVKFIHIEFLWRRVAFKIKFPTFKSSNTNRFVSSISEWKDKESCRRTSRDKRTWYPSVRLPSRKTAEAMTEVSKDKRKRRKIWKEKRNTTRQGAIKYSFISGNNYVHTHIYIHIGVFNMYVNAENGPYSSIFWIKLPVSFNKLRDTILSSFKHGQLRPKQSYTLESENTWSVKITRRSSSILSIFPIHVLIVILLRFYEKSKNYGTGTFALCC